MLNSVKATVSSDPMVESSDEEIVRAVIRGDRDLFRHLVLKYQNRVYSLIRRQVASHELAEELSQEVFLKAFKSLKQFRFDSKFSTWLTRIALNQTFSYFQSRRYKEARRTEDFEMDKHETQSSETPASEIERRKRLSIFRHAVAELKPIFRDVVTLCGLDGRSYEEVAEILKVPVGTVRSRLNKARLLLKESIGTMLLEEC